MRVASIRRAVLSGWLLSLAVAVPAFCADPDGIPVVTEGPEGAASPAVAIEAAGSVQASGPAEGAAGTEASAIPAAVVREEERARSFLAELNRFEAAFLQGRNEEDERADAALERIAALEALVRSAEAGSEAPNRLYDGIVEELKTARPALRNALDRRGDPAGVPRFAPGEPGVPGSPAAAFRLDRIGALHAEIARQRERLLALEEAGRWETVEARARSVRRLNALRIECLAKLSPGARAEILGLTRSGIAQLVREVDQLALMFRLHVATRARDLRAAPNAVRDVFVVSTATYTILRIGLVLAAALFLKRRGRSLIESARRALVQRSRGVRWTRRVETLFGAIQVAAPWTLFVAALYGLKWAAGPAIGQPEATIPFRLLVIYGLYRLTIDGIVAFIAQMARRYRLRLDAARTDKLISSVRTILRVVVGIAVLLTLSERFLGRGYLYNLVVDLAWILVLVALLRVLARWRNEISESYLEIGPPGALADLVRRSRDRWYGVFVAAASFGWLAGRATLTLARDFALGFDQTRKGLAFLFRRRVEKQAERQGYSEGRAEALPRGLRDAFTEEAVSTDPLTVDHFPGSDRFAELFGAWTAGRSGGTFLLAGERGIGKSTWLNRLTTDGATACRLTLTDRLLSPSDLVDDLGRRLEPASTCGGSLVSLRRSLLEGPRRVMILDRCENLFLATIGGYEAFEAFAALAESTCHHVFWVCSLTSYALDHLSAVRPDLAVFRARQILPRWSEEQIRRLIRARAAASGLRFTYEDLVVDRMEGVSQDARLLETEEGYTRLLWDYSDGNPRVALHFWLRSLVLESPDSARVRLFRAPSSDRLEEGGDEGPFLLAAIVQHQNLTVQEAVATTRFPEPLCRIHLDRFVELGALEIDRDRYRVTTRWHCAVIRLLKRKNLISD